MEKCKRCGSEVHRDSTEQYICGECGYNTRVDGITSSGKISHEKTIICPHCNKKVKVTVKY